MVRNLIIAMFLIVFCQTAWSAEIVELQLQDKLDEKRGFCIDIRGHKERAKVKKGLQAHSCYSYQGTIAVDQAFDRDLLKQGLFFMPAFDVCMEAEGYFKNAKLMLNECSDEAFQKFELTKNDMIKIKSKPEFCVVISSKKSRQGGGGAPPHLIRSLVIEDCLKVDRKYSTWRVNVVQ